MKCLSLRQPYAELLISGKKTIELRKWNTNFRGKFLIHASKNINKEKCKSLRIDYTKLNIGMIIGRAILYDVKKYDDKLQFMKDKSRHYANGNLFNPHIYVSILRMPNLLIDT
ncbi:MAG TPA: ASCH domain-containing protein [Nitrososphaeraceae archaeon]|jgi:hypothetical protein|nr:ASCH domain-containing protein [Nitrososphaeraceae archaeon]